MGFHVATRHPLGNLSTTNLEGYLLGTELAWLTEYPSIDTRYSPVRMEKGTASQKGAVLLEIKKLNPAKGMP